MTTRSADAAADGHRRMTADLLVRNVRAPVAGSVLDAAVTVRGGIVESVGAEPADWTGPVVDGGGDLCLPGFIDGHAHIATTLWGQPWRPHQAGPGLAGLLAHQREGRRGLAPVVERAAGRLAVYRDHGTTHVRAHVDVDPEIGLGHIEGALEAAARFDGVIDVEVVAFPQQGMLIAPGTTELMAAAVDAGASVIGGIDPAGLDGDPVTALDTLFGLADRSGVAIDIHLHDRGELGRWELGLIIDRTVALGLQGRVTVSHAFCLGDGSPAVEPILERLAEHRVAIATVAPGAPTRSRCCRCSTSASGCASAPTASVTCGRHGGTPTCSIGPGSWPGGAAFAAMSTSRPPSAPPRPSGPGRWDCPSAGPSSALEPTWFCSRLRSWPRRSSLIPSARWW